MNVAGDTRSPPSQGSVNPWWQRTRRYLRPLGLATEVLRGRQRTRDERMASWRVGDRGRGWASVWALHPRRPQPGDPSVDNHPQVTVLIQQTETPSGNGPVGTSPSVRNSLSTRQRSRSADTEDGAPRSASTKTVKKPGRAAPDGPGLALAKRWRAQSNCPAWATTIQRRNLVTTPSGLRRPPLDPPRSQPSPR